MEFRIGIHFGDVGSDATRIYGDGINIAPVYRPWQMRPARVYEEVAGKLDAEWQDIGEQPLKMKTKEGFFASVQHNQNFNKKD
jgi:hypothetical protein